MKQSLWFFRSAVGGPLFFSGCWSKAVMPFCLLSALVLAGCSARDLPFPTESCKIRTYIDLGVADYISNQYRSTKIVRLAVMPFDVPVTFARPGHDGEHFGWKLAREIQTELLSREEMGIVELFDRDRWPGKKDDFFQGNYEAIGTAHDAGYDLLLVGQMAEMTNAEDMVIFTKLIDLSSQVTLWFARTEVHSSARTWRSNLSRTQMFEDNPELFAFTERVEKFAGCTVHRMFQHEED